MEELEVPRVQIKVAVDRISAVKPAGPTPHAALYLSNLDDMVASRVLTPSVYFYAACNGGGGGAAEAIKRALSRVLVPYYPLAGRLGDAVRGKLEVRCTAEGAVLAEAHADAALAEVGPLGFPNPEWKPLLYSLPREGRLQIFEMPLVIAQVTRFSCGGFCVGLRICHCLCDGMGAMQFVNAWAETARGAAGLSVEPCWERERLRPRAPPLVQFSHAEFSRVEDNSNLRAVIEGSGGRFVQKCYRLRGEYQRRVKERAGVGCTTFEALAAHVWRCWVEAFDVAPGDQQMRLSFAANARSKFRPPLAHGFYGNLIGIACAVSTVGELRERPLAEAVRAVQKARNSITEEYIRSTIDYLEVRRPTAVQFSAKLSITQWTRFALYDTDFGWGRPVYAGPIDLSFTPQICVFLPYPSDADSILLCICLPSSVTSAFGSALADI